MTYDRLPSIRRDADAFLTAARRGLEERVPGCPDWNVRELTIHLGSVYRFHTAHVVRGVTTPPQFEHGPDPTDDDLLPWFDDCADRLLIALRRTDPDAPAWNWAPHTPQVASFWPRRMALETAVHRWDAQSAHAEATGFELAVALDGIDEMLTVMGPAEPPEDGPSGTAVVRTTEDEVQWAVRIAPGAFEVLPAAPEPPDAVLEGTASGLLLALYGRVGTDAIDARGDAAVIAALLS